jgi:hypothetical protein
VHSAREKREKLAAKRLQKLQAKEYSRAVQRAKSIAKLRNNNASISSNESNISTSLIEASAPAAAPSYHNPDV